MLQPTVTSIQLHVNLAGMAPLTGTFMASARQGAIQFPSPLRNYCVANEWNLFRVTIADGDRLDLRPILPQTDSDPEDDFHSSLSKSGLLWIPAALREKVSLGEQSVMMRVENEGVSIYLRKVFETLGFGP